jgi:oxidoreductase
MRAFVIGGTGAVGREVLRELLCDPAVARVTSLSRRSAVDGLPAEDTDRTPGRDLSKLDEVITPDVGAHLARTDLGDAAPSAHEAVFCCLGTTRADAGSAEAFRAVDLDLVISAARSAVASTEDSAEPAQTRRLPVFSMVSATNADKSSWFLYPKTKGQAEEAVRALPIPRIAIMRPGLLVRPDPRFGEKVFGCVLPKSMKIDVADCGRAMVRQAIADVQALEQGKEIEPCVFLDNAAMKSLAQEQQQQQQQQQQKQ